MQAATVVRGVAALALLLLSREGFNLLTEISWIDQRDWAFIIVGIVVAGPTPLVAAWVWPGALDRYAGRVVAAIGVHAVAQSVLARGHYALITHRSTMRGRPPVRCGPSSSCSSSSARPLVCSPNSPG